MKTALHPHTTATTRGILTTDFTDAIAVGMRSIRVPNFFSGRIRDAGGTRPYQTQGRAGSIIRAIRAIRGFFVLALLLSALPTARAATNTVLNLNDSGPGSLRQAIADAAPGDTIDFAVTGTITLTSGELVITNDLSITGPGATNLSVSGNNASRVIAITQGVVGISGLTVANGNCWCPGAGIYSSGIVTISRCVIMTNSAFGWSGGGIYNSSGTLRVQDSVIAGNGGNPGGGISSRGGSLTVVNTSISGNSEGGIGCSFSGTIAVTNATVSGQYGAGIGFSGAGGTISSSTIFNNNVVYSGGIHVDSGQATGPLNIQNCIVSGNWSGSGGADVIGPVTSLDFNLIGNTNGAAITGVPTHNIYGQDPLLGPLADNGGPTPTHALLPGSPAIDHGTSGGLATDQRGQPRPFNFPAYFNADDGSDIGAVEMQEGPQIGPVFTVNTTDDVNDGVAGIAHCSLREAIAAANANADTNTIDFAVAVPGLHTGVTGTITLTSGQLTITNSVNINGPGAANLTVSGNNASRVFSVTNSDVILSGLTIANGQTSFVFPAQSGGGLLNAGVATVDNCVIRNCSAVVGEGGGIKNVAFSTLRIKDSVVSQNSAEYAGGIDNRGTLIANNCTISSNLAGFGGGAVANVGSAAESLLFDCTVSGNTAGNIPGGLGGGLLILSGMMALTNCTVAHNQNTGSGSGGGLAVQTAEAAVLIHNTIIAGNGAASGPDCITLSGSAITSLDYNLIQNTNGCTITGDTSHNLYNQDPKLGLLADLGGPTPTHALRFDSPALDAGHSGGLTTDQRGLPRPIDDPNTPNAAGGDGSDIGAYETDPNLRITSIEKVGEDIRLRFNTVLGRDYRVDSADDITGSWNVLSNNITGDGSSKQTQDAGAASLPQRFYRGVMLLP